MNKKQTITSWLMILLLAIIIVRTIISLADNPIMSVFQFYYSFFCTIVIGGFFILFLKDRKK